MKPANRNRLLSAARSFWGGPVQMQRTLLPGVVAVSTPGHGGIVVDPSLFPLNPALIDGGSMHNVQRWVWHSFLAKPEAYRIVGFEEDCEWALLCIVHPEILAAAIRKGYLAPHAAEIDLRGYVSGRDEKILAEALAA